VTTFERRQSILQILQTQASVKVSDLARMLQVSEGTIRNDLIALDEEKQLRRVRGGAIVENHPSLRSQQVMNRAKVNSDAKQRIAQWAAGMVEDGDSIMLDASTSVLYLASYLRDRHHLTVITNGLDVARELAADPSNTVILIGGILRSDGSGVIGTLGEKMLQELHIQTAFVSCLGFSIETGLMERDIQEAQLKNRMIQAAQHTIALIDSTKFGKMGLTPFAQLTDIDHIVTDSAVSLGAIEQLQRSGTQVTVCGDNTISSFVSHDAEEVRYKIGFANLSETMPFSRDVRRSLERAAKAAGNIDLIVADNELNGETALHVADDLIEQGVELAIEYQIDAVAGSLIFNKFNRANIPVIAVDIPMIGATFVGVDNYQVGHIAGIALGETVKKQWEGQFDRLVVLEHPRTGDLPALRIKGQLDGFKEVIGSIPPDHIVYLDCGNTAEVSEEQMCWLLESLPDARRLPIICFNDDAVIGVWNAIQSLHREKDVLIVGQGADRRLREELRKRNPHIVGSTAFNPELYGEQLVEIALKILQGEHVAPAIYMPRTFINAENVDFYYPPSEDER
jgi:ribose transport system substrate-binding protein